ncbi:ABC transporter permease [Romboutsia maritimum]|uniref:ABC transporter permease n=1 Tax=Romboutsia maritimum TaxID=2020948 RepID=A0A371IRW4_9FIRM|nr:ABC transporter permease [Romboutsia maritimum]RDY23227.1 ABC transporter permease [Romboutsia maritimum]
MNSYTDIVLKQMKSKKKRNVLTLLGIIISVILFTSIGEYSEFIKSYRIAEAKYYEGNSEGIFYNISHDKIKFIENNVEIKDYSLRAEDFIGKYNLGNQNYNLKIYSVDENFISNTYKGSMNLVEGEFPKSSKEIILERKAKEQYNKKIGDIFNAGDKSYKISGFFQGTYTNSQDLIGLSNLENPDNYTKLCVFVRLNKTNGKVEILDRIAKDLDIEVANYDNVYNFKKSKVSYLEYNSTLLYYMGEDMTGHMIISQKIIELVMIIIVFISTVVLIYSSINSSITEKINQLSLLKCIGATPTQIRKIIFKESLILGGLSIFPGVLIGHLITWFIINIVVKNSMAIDFYGVNVKLSPKIILCVVFITLVTIILSTAKPALKASKISLIQGIKSNSLKLEKNIKKRKSKFLRYLLGVEGELAYRNLRANNRSFIITTLALSASLIMFLVFSGYIDAIIVGINKFSNNNHSDVEISTYTDIAEYIYNTYDYSKKDNTYDIDDEEFISCMLSRISDDDKLLNKIKENLIKDKIGRKIYKTHIMGKDLLIENIKSYDKSFDTTDLKYNEKLNGTVFHNGEILVYDDEAFNKINKEIKGNYADLIKFKNNGVIFVNPISVDLKGRIYEKASTSFKEKDNINIYPVNSVDSIEKFENPTKKDLEEAKKSKITLHVIGSIGKNQIIDSDRIMNDNTFSIIVSENTYDKYKDKMVDGDLNSIQQHKIGFDYYNQSVRKIYSEKLKDYITLDLGYTYEDHYMIKEHYKHYIIGMSIIIYSFAGLTMLISILNIINNRSSAILYRKKEFGTLMAIGMNKKDLIKSILFEGIVNWITPCIVSVPISCIILKFIYVNLIRHGDSRVVNMPIFIFIIGISGLLIINILSTLIPIIKLKKFDMIDMIKNEE